VGRYEWPSHHVILSEAKDLLRRECHVTKRIEPTPLADALTSYFKQAGLTKRVQQAGIIEQWAELVGPQIAAVTSPESVTPDGVLRVRVATAPWASELSLMSPKILARLNAGRSGRVKEIRWVPGPLER
jgi:predicted nucleic acid-binding Zn ribbon protein